jgi:hypothetical protein
LVTQWAVQRATKAASVADTATVVLAEMLSYCAPEPGEQLAFMLSLVLAPSLMALATLALSRRNAIGRIETSQRWLGPVALIAQAWVFGALLLALDFDASKAYGYQFLNFRSTIAIAPFCVPFLIISRLPAETRTLLRGMGTWLGRWDALPWAVATLWMIVQLSTTLMRDAELTLVPFGVMAHLPYTMGEFAATLNGRTPLVDFNSQYQNLYALLLAPWFKWVGFNLFTFSTTMAVLSMAGFLSLYSAMVRICRSAWLALLFFLPMTAITLGSGEPAAGGYVSSVANYYAAIPIRYLVLFVMTRLVVSYLEKPVTLRLILVTSVGAVLTLNNLDFGIPSMAGLIACAMLFPPAIRGWFRPARIVAAVGICVTTCFATLGLCLGLIRLGVGVWPFLGQITQYQKAFASVGFFMLPLPEKGFYWLMYATGIAAVLVPIFETFSVDAAKIAHNRRLINGSLVHAGIVSLGALAYYIGRSHPMSIGMPLCAWSYVLVLFAHRAWIDWRATRVVPRNAWLAPVPAVMLSVGVGMSGSGFATPPNLLQQLYRLGTKSPLDDSANLGVIALIQKYVPPGKSTVIAYRDAHWLALRAKVNNLYPFAHYASIILLDQLDAVMAALYQLPPSESYFFGRPPAELRQRLLDNGFRQLDAVGDFAVWKRAPSENGHQNG